jgi:hypothetical protein
MTGNVSVPKDLLRRAAALLLSAYAHQMGSIRYKHITKHHQPQLLEELLREIDSILKKG